METLNPVSDPAEKGDVAGSVQRAGNQTAGGMTRRAVASPQPDIWKRMSSGSPGGNLLL